MLQGEPWHKCKKWELPSLKAATINHARRSVQRVLNTASFWILKKHVSVSSAVCMWAQWCSPDHAFISKPTFYSVVLHISMVFDLLMTRNKAEKKAGGITPTEWPDLWNATWTEETSYTGRGTYDKRWRTARGRDSEKLSCKRVVGSYIKFYSM